MMGYFMLLVLVAVVAFVAGAMTQKKNNTF